MKPPLWGILFVLSGLIIVSLTVKKAYEWFHDRRDRESFDVKSLPSSKKQK